MEKKYVVVLSEGEQAALREVISKGKHRAQEIRGAHTLLMSDSGKRMKRLPRCLRSAQ